MNRILLTMAAVSAVAIGAPAMAQYPGGSTGIQAGAGTDQLSARIDAGIRQGTISRQEAASLRTQLRTLTRLERQYSIGGFSVQERTDLQQRTRTLRQQIRVADGGGYGRDDDRWSENDGRDGRDGRDCPPGLDKRDNGCVPPGQEGRDGRWEDRRDGRYENGARVDANRDGYDDRDLNRDGRIDSADQGYQDRDRRGGVFGDAIDRLTGSDGLRVGQRASADLGAVPYDLRSQYRDGSGAYYRADRRNVYRIDARTNLVMQVFALNR
ncbi:MAG: hypothetical protein QOI38_1046 [Sphingomonadales bacterium]|jgi:hypothetical protein|nr:hypothetical protein [Sphingomonadales bacterium]